MARHALDTPRRSRSRLLGESVASVWDRAVGIHASLRLTLDRGDFPKSLRFHAVHLRALSYVVPFFSVWWAFGRPALWGSGEGALMNPLPGSSARQAASQYWSKSRRGSQKCSKRC